MNKQKQHGKPGLGSVWRACSALAFAFFMAAGPATAGEKPFVIESSAFAHGEEIPVEYTCQGRDMSPPLTWKGLPEGTQSLVLIVDDPDAPDPRAPKVRWVHWVLYNIPADAAGLPQGVRSENLPPGTGQGLNGWQRTGYGGPCPPIGRHRYFHALYALDTVLTGLVGPTRSQVQVAMKGHVLARTELVGTYEKSK